MEGHGVQSFLAVRLFVPEARQGLRSREVEFGPVLLVVRVLLVSPPLFDQVLGFTQDAVRGVVHLREHLEGVQRAVEFCVMYHVLAPPHEVGPPELVHVDRFPEGLERLAAHGLGPAPHPELLEPGVRREDVEVRFAGQLSWVLSPDLVEDVVLDGLFPLFLGDLHVFGSGEVLLPVSRVVGSVATRLTLEAEAGDRFGLRRLGRGLQPSDGFLDENQPFEDQFHF